MASPAPTQSHSHVSQLRSINSEQHVMERGTRAGASLALCCLCFITVTAALGNHFIKPDRGVLDDEHVATSMRTYSLEDFFWTGSGDGPFPPEPQGFYVPSVISTKTILATVYVDSPDGGYPDSNDDCLTECPINPKQPGDIIPTKTSSGGQPLPDPSYWLLTVLRAPAPPLPPNLEKSLARLYQKAFIRQQERHLGIAPTSVALREKHHINIKENDRNSSILVVKNPLDDIEMSSTQESFIDESDFMREKDEEGFAEYPFEFLNTSTRLQRSIMEENKRDNSSDVVKRDVYPMEPPPSVEVFLYNVSKDNMNTNDSLRVIYWVSVGGRPVPARTAARDMLLLADAEVAAELGYPVTTKAEPYLKMPETSNGITKLSNSRDLWLIVGAAILTICIILITISLLTCRMVTKKKSAAPDHTLSHSKEIRPFYPEKGKDNPGFITDKDIPVSVTPAKTYPTKMVDSNYAQHGDNGSDSYESTSTISDLSQMTATLRQKQKLFEHQMQNDYAIINKKNKYKNKKIRSRKVGVSKDKRHNDTLEIPKDGTFQQFSISDGSSSSCDSIIIRKPSGVVSPTSYLSMPSVKSFPRGNAVEPLSRVLEPLSVRHLDIDTDSPIHSSRPKRNDENPNIVPLHKKVTCPSKTIQIGDPSFRYGSMDKDPGVVSPMVWNMHCKRMQDGVGSDTTDNSQMGNISRMRKRFNELVDDAFSLFSSGNTSLKSQPQAFNIDATEILKTNKVLGELPNRRHSTKDGQYYIGDDLESQRPHTALPQRPPLPLNSITSLSSAWGSTSTVEMGGHQRPHSTKTMLLNATDPSLPLLQAIKKELDKLPGTSDA